MELLSMACLLAHVLIQQTGCSRAKAFNALRPYFHGLRLDAQHDPLKLSAVTFWRVYSQWQRSGGSPAALRQHFDRSGRKPKIKPVEKSFAA